MFLQILNELATQHDNNPHNFFNRIWRIINQWQLSGIACHRMATYPTQSHPPITTLLTISFICNAYSIAQFFPNALQFDPWAFETRASSTFNGGLLVPKIWRLKYSSLGHLIECNYLMCLIPFLRLVPSFIYVTDSPYESCTMSGGKEQSASRTNLNKACLSFIFFDMLSALITENWQFNLKF